MNDCGVRYLSGRNRGHVQFILYIIQFGNDESVNSLFTGTFRLLDNACILFGEQRYGTECFYQIIVSHRPEKAGLCGQRSIIVSCNIRCATIQQDVTFLHNLIEYFPIIAYNRSSGVESLVIAVKHTFGRFFGNSHVDISSVILQFACIENIAVTGIDICQQFLLSFFSIIEIVRYCRGVITIQKIGASA